MKEQGKVRERVWTHIGGDLEASYDGVRYVDIRARARDSGGRSGRVLFMSRGTLRGALKLFRPAPIAE